MCLKQIQATEGSVVDWIENESVLGAQFRPISTLKSGHGWSLPAM
jgi:hypothetical protein